MGAPDSTRDAAPPTPPLPDIIRDALRYHLTRLGITRAELARRTGVSKQQIGAIAAGRIPRPSLDTIWRIADALDLTLDALLSATDAIAAETIERCSRCGAWRTTTHPHRCPEAPYA